MNDTAPVAWRWRWKDLPDAGWQLGSVGGCRDTEHIEAQPLYLHPPHQPKRTVTYVCPVCAASVETLDVAELRGENAVLLDLLGDAAGVIYRVMASRALP